MLKVAVKECESLQVDGLLHPKICMERFHLSQESESSVSSYYNLSCTMLSKEGMKNIPQKDIPKLLNSDFMPFLHTSLSSHDFSLGNSSRTQTGI